MDGEVIEGASSHTTGHMSGRVQVVAPVSGRRIFTVERKLAILRDAFGPGGSVRGACERHEVSSGTLYTWRKNAMSGQLGLVRPGQPVFAELGGCGGGTAASAFFAILRRCRVTVGGRPPCTGRD